MNSVCQLATCSCLREVFIKCTWTKSVDDGIKSTSRNVIRHRKKREKSTNLCDGVPRRALREIIVYLCHCSLDHVHHLTL